MAVKLPSEVDRLRNARMGFRQGWAVNQKYEFASAGSLRVLRAVEREGIRRFYLPVVEPGLVEEFARVDSEGELKRFAERFGLVGFQQAVPHARRVGGDPVGWAVARAKEISIALEIQALLKEVQRTGRETELRRELPKLLRKVKFGLNPFTARVAGFSRWRETSSWPDDPARTAWECLGDIINPHLRRVHYEITPGDAADAPDLKLRFDSLIDVIAWRLATQLRGLKPFVCDVCGRLGFAARSSRRTCSGKCRKEKMKLDDSRFGLSKRARWRKR